MSATRIPGLFAVLVLAAGARADITQCVCDPAAPQTLEARECSLTREALKQPPEQQVFYLKDISPRKPNRWLALPREVRHGRYRLAEMTPAERTALWSAAIEKAKELWGEEWGLAYNGDKVRTQCHVHIHIGKLLKGLQINRYVVVRGPEEIPAPQGDGIWVQPWGKKLRVHLGENITETVLLR